MRRFLSYLPYLLRNLNDTLPFYFFDYDGTLTPLTGRPKEATFPASVRADLARLSAAAPGRVVVISGRVLSDVARKVGIPGIIYSGNHGLEVRGPDIRYRAMTTKRTQLTLRTIASALSRSIREIRGAFIEDKRLSLALHYRRVGGPDIPRVFAAFKAVTCPFRKRKCVRVAEDKMTLEVRPPGKSSKGTMARWILSRCGRRLKDRILPVYFGDGLTDETAFAALRKDGITVRVGRSHQTQAKYCVRGPAQIGKIIDILAEMEEKRRKGKR